MDINGNNGSYFRASVFAWGAIVSICRTIIRKHDLKISLNGWMTNEGYGIETANACIMLADKLEAFYFYWINKAAITDEDGMIYVAHGSPGTRWSKYGELFSVAENEDELNQQFSKGTIFSGPVVASDGEIVECTYRVSIRHFLSFINFLRICEGFKIN